MYVSVLCPCVDCIVKLTCSYPKDKSTCIGYKRFKKKYLDEVMDKSAKNDFQTKIPIKKRKGRK